MSAILAYVTDVFNWLFVGTPGTNPVPAAITQVVTFITSNAYCMVGLSLMLAGAAVSFLSKIIRNS